jgi:hypothetical protein
MKRTPMAWEAPLSMANVLLGAAFLTWGGSDIYRFFGLTVFGAGIASGTSNLVLGALARGRGGPG